MMRTTVTALFLLMFLLPLVPFTPGAVALTDYEEGFEDDTSGFGPTASFYAGTSSGTVAVTPTLALSGSKSLRYIDTDGGAPQFNFAFAGVGVDLCNGGVISFAFRTTDATPSGGNRHFFRMRQNSLAGFAAGFAVESDGSVKMEYPGVTTTTISGITVQDNTWYNVTFGAFECDAPNEGFGVAFTDQGVGQLMTTGNQGGPWNFFETSFGDSVTITGYLDNLVLAGVDDPPPTAVGSTATVAVTNLVGFDVDTGGSGVIARVDAGDEIKSFTPTTLSVLATREVDCNGVGNQVDDMVAVSDFGLVYVVCDSGTSNPAFFSIRTYNDGAPNFPGCDPSDCLDDIDLRSGNDCSTGDDDFPDDLSLREIGDVASVPLSYSYETENVFGSRAVAFAYSADNGNIGVLQYTAVNLGDDRCVTKYASFAGSAPEQMSVWQPDPDDEAVYIAAVDNAGANKFYIYTPQKTGSPAKLDGSLTGGSELGGTTNGVAVSCAELLCLVVTTATTDNVRLINVQTGASIWTATATNEVARGAALSANGDWAIYLDGTTAYVAYASNGTTFGSLTLPAGTFKEVRLHGLGQRAWIATTSVIAYYDIQAAFPDVIPTGCLNPPCDDQETDDDQTTGFINIPIGGDSPFANATLGGLFFGVVMMGMVATGTFYTFNKNIIGALIGALIGFCVAWALGLFTTAIVTTIVILALIGFGVRFWIARNNTV